MRFCINGRVCTFIVLRILEEVHGNYLKMCIILSYVCVCVCGYISIGMESLCGYEAGDLGCKIG
jgi:hypothetical protein